MTNNLKKAAELIATASYEHPGFISLSVGNIHFAFGDINGPIGYDYGPDDDLGAPRSSGDNEIPAGSSPDEIVAYVLSQVVHVCSGDAKATNASPYDELQSAAAATKYISNHKAPQVAQLEEMFADPELYEKFRSMRKLAIRLDTELEALRQSSAKSESTSSPAVAALRSALEDSPCVVRVKTGCLPSLHIFSDLELEEAIRALLPHLRI